MTTKLSKENAKQNRLKKEFFNRIWKTFYRIAVDFENSGNQRLSNMFFEICSKTLDNKDYFFSQRTIEDTLNIFSKEIDFDCKSDLQNHLEKIKEITKIY